MLLKRQETHQRTLHDICLSQNKFYNDFKSVTSGAVRKIEQLPVIPSVFR